MSRSSADLCGLEARLLLPRQAEQLVAAYGQACDEGSDNDSCPYQARCNMFDPCDRCDESPPDPDSPASPLYRGDTSCRRQTSLKA